MKYTIKSIPTKPASIALTMALSLFSHYSLAAQESETVQESEIGVSEEDVQKESNEDIVKRLAELGPGVQEIKTLDNGKLRSLKVVGQTRISKVLGKAKGVQIAQQKAKMSAQQAFVEWMKTHATSITTDENEETIVIIGNGGEPIEEGKATEISKNSITAKASGLISGLSLVARDVSSDEETLTLVYIWSPKRAAQAGEAAEKNNQNEESAKKSSATSEKATKPSRTVVSPDFDE